MNSLVEYCKKSRAVLSSPVQYWYLYQVPLTDEISPSIRLKAKYGYCKYDS